MYVPMSDGEKMVWASVYGSLCSQVIKDPPPNIAKNTKEIYEWRLTRLELLCADACEAVELMRELPPTVAKVLGVDDASYKMLSEMLGGADDDVG